MPAMTAKIGAFELATRTLLDRYGTIDPERLKSLGADDVELGAARNILKRAAGGTIECGVSAMGFDEQRTAAADRAETVLAERLRTGYELALAAADTDEKRAGVELCWLHIGASYGQVRAHSAAVLVAAAQQNAALVDDVHKDANVRIERRIMLIAAEAMRPSAQTRVRYDVPDGILYTPWIPARPDDAEAVELVARHLHLTEMTASHEPTQRWADLGDDKRDQYLAAAMQIIAGAADNPTAGLASFRNRQQRTQQLFGAPAVAHTRTEADVA